MKREINEHHGGRVHREENREKCVRIHIIYNTWHTHHIYMDNVGLTFTLTHGNVPEQTTIPIYTYVCVCLPMDTHTYLYTILQYKYSPEHAT